MKPSQVILSLAVTIASTAAGCAAEQEGPEILSLEAKGVVEEGPGTLLTSIDIAPGHVVQFYEVEPGLLVTSESGKDGIHSPVLEDRKYDSYVDMFKALAPGQAVPQTLVAAEERRQILEVETQDWPAPDDAAVALSGNGPTSFTSGEQQWFRETFCPGSVKCIQGWDWITSGNDHTSDWKSTVWVGSEGTAVARHQTWLWKLVFIQGPEPELYIWEWMWWPMSSAAVPPNHWQWLSAWGDSKFYFRSALEGAGNTQVSMAIHAKP